MEEIRKIGDYSVKYSMYIGHKDIALGENPNADKDERYMCCFVETNAIFERYSGVLVSDDFAEIAKVFGQRVADAAEEIVQENERACQEVGMNRNSWQKAARRFPTKIPLRTRWLSSRAASSGLSSAMPITSLCCVPAALVRRQMREAVPATAFLCTTGERPPFIARIFSVSWRKRSFPNGRRRAWRKQKRYTRRKRNRLKKEVTQDDRV